MNVKEGSIVDDDDTFRYQYNNDKFIIICKGGCTWNIIFSGLSPFIKFLHLIIIDHKNIIFYTLISFTKTCELKSHS